MIIAGCPAIPASSTSCALEGLFLFWSTAILRAIATILTNIPAARRACSPWSMALSRIVVEFFREPDAQLGYFAGFITMGMILSLPLLAIGIWLAASRKSPRDAA